jgi:hypothetical protein
MGALVLLLSSAARAGDAEVLVQAANLHNPHFMDRLPGTTPRAGEHFLVAPPPRRLAGFAGDTVAVPFTVVSNKRLRVQLTAHLLDGTTQLGAIGPDPRAGHLSLLRARDVQVEGNSNASCSCPAGQLPQTAGEGVNCVSATTASESLTPRHCPTRVERVALSSTLVRVAPFSIKDPLEPLDHLVPLVLEPGRTELLIVDVPILAGLPRKTLNVQLTVRPEGSAATSASLPLTVMPQRLDSFPAMDLSYWLSEDPRDLIARPQGTPIDGRWGGDWWSDEHWSSIQRAAELQGRLGVTNTLMPLFVRNPFGIESRALVPIRCITGSTDVPLDASADPDQRRRFNAEVAKWHYAFDFAGFRRWAATFRKAGFRQFEGAHLFANGGELPTVLECDLYGKTDDKRPYARNFRFLPRVTDSGQLTAVRSERIAIYRDRFLPGFLAELAIQLREAGIAEHYLQHVIDENASSDEAIAAYASAASMVRKHLPRVRIIDAINKYSALRYQGLIDVPVIHLILLYNDQADRAGLRREIEERFPGPKYFYNTALRRGGPNRFLDSNPLDSRAHGWIALEAGYGGFLYWAANQYRYPPRKDANLSRPEDWSPYLYSQGPWPGGRIAPAYGAGGNWLLYPTSRGLTDSLRARRLRDGLLDHWIYRQAEAACKRDATSTCTDRLEALRKAITRDSHAIGDLSRNPADYDDAREQMLRILEK